jgi:membrane protease subunit HflK
VNVVSTEVQGDRGPRDGSRRSERFRWARKRLWAALALVALASAYLGSGFYIVEADERAVLRRFGAELAVAGPGMHHRLPWPFTRLDVLKTTAVMKAGVGFTLSDDGEVVTGKEVLTGDTNLLNVALVLQYVIDNPADYLFQTERPERMIAVLAESILTDTVLGMPVDEVLTTGRLAIQEAVKREAQAMLDRYRTGLRLSTVSIMGLTLDGSVAQAFQDVADAMADREKASNDARTYANNLLPKARGEAHARVSAAHSRKQLRVAEAVGDTTRFLALLREYEKAPELTRARLYAEQLETILAKVKLYVVDSQDGRVPLRLRISEP